MEIWKDIKNYEELYQVSNRGQIRSYKNGLRKIQLRRDGYVQLLLYKKGISKMFKVHRLVAQAFISNPDNLPEINHKDEDKTNNCVDNLEWCDRSYNNTYNSLNKRRASSAPKAIVAIINGKRINFPSSSAAARKLGISTSGIHDCLRGNKKKCF
ncbi:MAG: NUMOD4 domain-containing protein [Oenococcus oeni]